MNRRLAFLSLCTGLLLITQAARLLACCAVSRQGAPVLNADQTVLIMWDAASKTQHFIRQASFVSSARDIGFLVPSPTMPELDESGDAAFDHLQRITAPQVVHQRPPAQLGCGCGAAPKSGAATKAVRVLAEQRVAGFDAVVLEADSADDLVSWLQEHEYEFSPEVQEWAAPYVDAGWKITALKVATDEQAEETGQLSAASLRISFQTDRPLFPYREPDPVTSAQSLKTHRRLLRIFFIGDGPYRGEFTDAVRWSGTVAWSDRVTAADRATLLSELKVPESSVPAAWWLTEFEQNWPYAKAASDLYFAQSDAANPVHRDPIIVYAKGPWRLDPAAGLLLMVFVLWPLSRYAVRRSCSGLSPCAVRGGKFIGGGSWSSLR